MIAVVTGTVIDDDREVRLAQLCRACGLSVETVRDLVEHGILEPTGGRPGRWRFPGDSIRRARLVARLQRDLEINLAGAALALGLLDRIEALQTRLGRVENPTRHRNLFAHRDDRL